MSSNANSRNKRKRTPQPGQLTHHDPLLSGLKVVSLPPREKQDFGGIRADLDEHGFSVVANLLSSSERERFQSLFFRAVQARKPALKRDDMSTWTPENVEWKGTFGVGHFKHYGMAQEKHCWQIRLNAAIKAIYQEAVYDGEKELCVSMDALAGLFRIPDQNKAGSMRVHVDLVPGREGCTFDSVQSAYNCFEVEVQGGKGCAGFVCVPGSNKTYDERWAARQAPAVGSRPLRPQAAIAAIVVFSFKNTHAYYCSTTVLRIS